ncbi:hypothetical protein F5B22DRAFT_660514 [Xylaria bambusicola]|uniref:uncharacterized protein n=1 Tax=Xylaria bambusicola TaxID=326684 RepID=UPI00200836C9|nr:uncharacterized protein F5B22DRAFT_660514 [Xylaria bambusicola]KAI0522180.1 hypothetical protein F5B22DRAFT_660514 [Xylaria bambusicola]
MSANPSSGVGQVRKRLFVFCDGTWQDGVNKSQPPTNVGTLARCLEGVSEDNYLQIVYYDSGIGNGTSWFGQRVDAATGRGIEAKIRNAFSFLSHNYTFGKQESPPNDTGQDEIILVGYSRGAFAVQCLASFISQTGLLEPQHLYYLRGLFTLWENRDLTPLGRGPRTPIQIKLNEEVDGFLTARILHKVPIKACVLWDTVSSLGSLIPRPRRLSHVGNTVPEAVQNAFQALALNETRTQFQPCIWKSKENKDTFAKQCWFLGSHGDVGGGQDAALGAVTLIWMIGLLQARTGTKFSLAEIGKHLRHKLLEWDFHVNHITGRLTQITTLTRMSTLGQATTMSPLWWITGMRNRQIVYEAGQMDSRFQVSISVHFTVRFAMSKDSHACPVLRDWKTTPQPNGVVLWEGQNSVLLEEELDEKNISSHEYKYLRDWCDDNFPVLQTDRDRFAEQHQADIQTPGSHESLDSFLSLLRECLIFEEHKLAPGRHYNTWI